MSDKPMHSSDSSSELTKKKVTDNPPDVVLLCEGERISCHREILANASSYFSAMFNSSFAEKDEPVITIHVSKSYCIPSCCFKLSVILFRMSMDSC